MSDNVFLFGAGSSASAGIPLMGTFMETMWKIARTGFHGDLQATPDQKQVLAEAFKVREELDGYHGRVAIDIWNIEDILSVLSFAALAGGKAEKKRLDWITRAMCVVIEMTCAVKHDGGIREERKPRHKHQIFWNQLIDWSIRHRTEPPPILTFNYDLVLERSLLHALVGTHYNSANFRYPGICIDYGTELCGPVYLKMVPATWRRGDSFQSPQEPGYVLERVPQGQKIDGALRIRILKLHGSLNFPRPKTERPADSVSTLIHALNDPVILPPVFNKASDSVGKDVWNTAMKCLRLCKHFIVCGYSMPASDVYMQYFLKASLGPNLDLDRVFVFDPILHSNNGAGDALENRYSSILSETIRKRINFQPGKPGHKAPGTMHHLTDSLADGELLFG